MVSPFIIGAGINAVSGLWQQKRAQRFEGQKITMLAKDAKRAGIHPLAALGAVNYQNPYAGRDPIGAAASDIGKHAAAKEGESVLKENARKEGELLVAQTEEARSRTRLNNANSVRASGGPTAPALYDDNGRPIIHTQAQYILPSGEKVVGVNPEAAEVGPGELAIHGLAVGAGEGYAAVRGAYRTQDAQREYFDKFERSLRTDVPYGTIVKDEVFKRFEWQYTKSGWRRRAYR